MIFKRLHKWVLGLAILVSVFSFDGFINHTERFAKNTTELVVIKKPSNRLATYYFGTTKSKSDEYSQFRFKSLLRNYNRIDELKFETSKSESLVYLNHLHFIMISHTYNQNDNIVTS